METDKLVGEWIYAGMNSFGIWYICSNCNYKTTLYTKFCPKCNSRNK